MKPLSPATDTVVTRLRCMKNAAETLHDRSSLTYALGEAISRLSLLDVALQRIEVLRPQMSEEDRRQFDYALRGARQP